MRTNKEMRRFGPLVPAPRDALPMELQDLLEAGWQIGPVGSLLLSGMYGSGWRTDWAADLVAEHEYEVNDVWIPPADLPSEREVFLRGMSSRALGFANLILKRAAGLEAAHLLIAVISVGTREDYLTSGTTVRLFTRRNRYPRHFVDLERFRWEAVALVEMSDVP